MHLGLQHEQRNLFALPSGVEESHQYFRLEGLVFPPWKKKINKSGFLSANNIFSTSKAKSSPRGFGWTELWLVLLRDVQAGVPGLSVGWE